MEKTLGEKIREERKKNKLTQKQLAGDFITRNMLSQIENDQAKPSITTMAYLAKQLNKSIDYFMTQQTKAEQMAKLAQELMTDYKEDQCSEVLERLDKIKETSPIIYHSEFIEDLYVNCHFKKAAKAMKVGNYSEAIMFYEALLEFESKFLLNNELTAYELYTDLVEAYTYLGRHELANDYNVKAKALIRKLMASKEVQNLYLLFTQGDLKETIKSAQKVEVEVLDEYNQARYHMVVGSTYCDMEMFELAIQFLEKAYKYYDQFDNNSLTVMILEQLSKAYLNIDNKDKAMEYLAKAKKNNMIH